MPDWRLTNTFACVRPPSAPESVGVFHAGRVNDALRLMQPGINTLLVACPESGVWWVSEAGGPAIPLSASTLDVRFNALAAGVYSNQHVYAAGETLVESDVTAAVPLLQWRHIDLLVLDDKGVETPLLPGEIHRIVVSTQRRRLVMACDKGVFWAPIPPSPGGPYLFRPAQVVDAATGASLKVNRFSSVALSVGDNIVAGAWGTDKAQQWGIFYGTWSTSSGGVTDLIFQRVAIRGAIDQTQMFRTEIASCTANRSVMYAVAGGGGNLTSAGTPDSFGNLIWKNSHSAERILAVLRSQDFGLSWDVLRTTVIGDSQSPADLAGTNQDGENICIGVSPFDPQRVAIGSTQTLLSKDSGQSWSYLDPTAHAELHADIHAVMFDPADPAGTKLFVCSDGGVAGTADFGVSFDTSCNRQLTNLQFRRFAASAHDSGVIAGSLQDNGNVYVSLYPTLDPWRDTSGGDGVEVALLTDGSLVEVPNPLDDSSKTIQAAGYTWHEAARRFTAINSSLPIYGIIPLDGAPNGLMAETDDFGFTNNRIQSVADPTFSNSAGERMVGVTVQLEAVYGLFAGAAGSLHWTRLAAVPHMPDIAPDKNERPYFGTACVSRTGQAIFVGTNNGHVFRLDAPAFVPVHLGTPGGDNEVFGLAELPDGTLFVNTGSFINRSIGGGPWKTVLGVLPDDTFFAICVDPTTAPPAVYVGGARSVQESTDGGDTWSPTHKGLPAAINCRDLQFVTEVSGANFLYASTFGWSAFRRLLNADEIQRTVTVDGHMDIVDRVAFGKDDWAHPKISNTFVLGPYHPIDEAEYVADDGDEVRVRLKIHLEWHLDFSVTVRFDAWLIDKEEDGGSIDAEAHGSFAVPFPSASTETIDLASDDVWPDRAHIEFTVANT